MRKRALIIGISGQDGYFLTEFLHSRQYDIYGTTRHINRVSYKIVDCLVKTFAVNVTDHSSLINVVESVEPDEIYYLAAYHFSSSVNNQSLINPNSFISVNLLPVNAILETLVEKFPKSKFFYASSSHIFGIPYECPQTEATHHSPNSFYGISKSAATHICRYYRENYSFHASVGILYNHESPRRPDSFVSSKIAKTAAQAKVGIPTKLNLHNLDAVVDWGAAQDYVRAMWCTLQYGCGDDYIIASSKKHTVRDFVDIAFEYVDLLSENFLESDANVVTTQLPYIGDNTKLERICGWKPTVSFIKMVHEMVDSHLDRLKSPGSNGFCGLGSLSPDL